MCLSESSLSSFMSNPFLEYVTYYRVDVSIVPCSYAEPRCEFRVVTLNLVVSSMELRRTSV